MKKSLFLTIAACAVLLTGAPGVVHASPASKKSLATTITQTCRTREARLMMIHELTRTPERRQEVAKVLADKGYSVRFPSAEATGAAEGQTANRATNNLGL